MGRRGRGGKGEDRPHTPVPGAGRLVAADTLPFLENVGVAVGVGGGRKDKGNKGLWGETFQFFDPPHTN